MPLEINDNGDVLLTNPVINFEAEYSASHKLLLQYDKTNNIDIHVNNENDDEVTFLLNSDLILLTFHNFS